MSTPARKRLVRDFKRLQQDPPQGVNASPNPDNILCWNAVIFGPEDTPWAGGTFKLTLNFSEGYPNSAPNVKFVSKIFHPNVYLNGAICLDILQHQWSPIYDVAAILTSIQSLLSDPNPGSPANSEAARLYLSNRRAYNTKVRGAVEASWIIQKKAAAAAAAAAASSSGNSSAPTNNALPSAATPSVAAAALPSSSVALDRSGPVSSTHQASSSNHPQHHHPNHNYQQQAGGGSGGGTNGGGSVPPSNPRKRPLSQPQVEVVTID